ncbi:MAG TPA: iron ABC transporter permease [Balneola sp.]|nr:iron ABC transporter permease [Bacteroidota bacterium]HCT51500.1 iron ABC transporter permease [Balneola sp.]|tara:strand:- start:8138 stop:9838 length:1701 start_codon:yes stop_codon:yes gene_type:complete
MFKALRFLAGTFTSSDSNRYPTTLSKKWASISGIIAILVSIPILSVLSSFFISSGEIWRHLASTVLGDYITNSLLLIVGVSSGVVILGVALAWIITMCNFPGQKYFEWAAVLPFSIPAYLLAYIYTDFFGITGTLQTAVRSTFDLGISEFVLPEIRSIWGAIFIMILAFYPYVYMLARSAFLNQSVSLFEASRIMGYTTTQSFFKIALPLARPGIAAGLALALMETLNDFGTVQYFGVQTFTTGIYRTWFGLGERPAAAQLAGFLLLFIIVLILLERWSRSRIKDQTSATNRFKRIQKFNLTGLKKWGAFFLCALPVFFGFILPVLLLLSMFFNNLDSVNTRFLLFSLNTLSVAAIAGLITVAVALLMAYSSRLNPSKLVKGLNQFGALGYAIPGSVIAVGVLIPFGWLDNTIDSFARSNFQVSTGLLLSGTLFAMIFAYVVRFLSVSYNGINSSLQKISPSVDEASRGMGYSFSEILRKIHIPMLSGGLLSAFLLVFVDVMKELPATIIIRPFNFDTLAVQVYRLASDERLGESAGAALAIVLVGIIPVILLSKTITRSRKTEEH